MQQDDISQFIGMLAVTLLVAKVVGGLANRAGQPSVLGELVAGVFLGPSVFAVVNPNDHVLHVLSEIGVIILLFEIGLETDLQSLMRSGGVSAVVAIVGVVLPFALGYGVCRLLGLKELVGVVAGATLTATSVGITARVLSDLERLKEPEGQIVLGAAVIDDVIGLVILAVVAGLTHGEEVTFSGVAQKAGAQAFGFLFGTLIFGQFLIPPIVRWASRIALPGTPTFLAVVLAFGLAWSASVAGSATIIGAFAAGLLLRTVPQARAMEKGVAQLGHFFVPLFFVIVGSAVDIRVFNVFDPNNHQTLLVGGLLTLAAIVGKFLAGYAPFWFKGKKAVIGVAMIPRGEVGLIFAQMGLAAGVFDAGLFSAVTMTVLITTFLAPPLLKLMLPPRDGDLPPNEAEGIEELVQGD